PSFASENSRSPPRSPVFFIGLTDRDGFGTTTRAHSPAGQERNLFAVHSRHHSCRDRRSLVFTLVGKPSGKRGNRRSGYYEPPYRVARRPRGRPALSELGVKVSLHPAQALRTPL